jgi:hypothetical protein
MNSDSDRDLLLISVFTFFTVLLWITFELLKTIKTTTTQTNVQQIVVPFNPKIDTDTIIAVDNLRVY